MNYFTLKEIFNSVIYSIIYGFIFSAFYNLEKTLISNAKDIAEIPRNAIYYDKVFSLLKQEKNYKFSIGKIFIFVSILLFTIGYVVLSYFALDGLIRFYVLFFSLISFYLSNILVFSKLGKLLYYTISFVLSLVTISLRLILYPIKVLHNIIKKLIKSKKTNIQSMGKL